jgi:HPt (histidine-containing phosphotransfer) domain-containing protein
MPDKVELPIFAMTANALVGDAEKSIEAGMNGHISKPVNPEELYHILSAYLPKLTDARQQPAEESNSSWLLAERFSPYIDLKRGVKQVGGKPDFYLKLLRDFVTGHGDAVDEIATMIETGKMADARRTAHTLNGVCGNIGAYPLQQAASALEDCLKVGKPPSDSLLEDFQEACEALLNALDEIIPAEDLLPSKRQQSAPGSLPEDKLKLDEFLQILSTGAAASVGMFGALKPLLEQKIGAQKTALIEEFIDSYEFERAEELLSQALEIEDHDHA